MEVNNSNWPHQMEREGKKKRKKVKEKSQVARQNVNIANPKGKTRPRLEKAKKRTKAVYQSLEIRYRRKWNQFFKGRQSHRRLPNKKENEQEEKKKK